MKLFDCWVCWGGFEGPDETAVVTFTLALVLGFWQWGGCSRICMVSREFRMDKVYIIECWINGCGFWIHTIKLGLQVGVHRVGFFRIWRCKNGLVLKFWKLWFGFQVQDSWCSVLKVKGFGLGFRARNFRSYTPALEGSVFLFNAYA